ncbi:hypothetical protein GEMRC1_010156 [Eukaryota sp. GEM-RC1]
MCNIINVTNRTNSTNLYTCCGSWGVTLVSVTTANPEQLKKVARALADALKVNTSVKSIDLQWNCIGDVGARALADALKFNDTVTNVDLFANSIGDDAVRALAEVLKANEKIKISGVSQLNL